MLVRAQDNIHPRESNFTAAWDELLTLLSSQCRCNERVASQQDTHNALASQTESKSADFVNQVMKSERIHPLSHSTGITT